jgi:hypothetical protein
MQRTLLRLLESLHVTYTPFPPEPPPYMCKLHPAQNSTTSISASHVRNASCTLVCLIPPTPRATRRPPLAELGGWPHLIHACMATPQYSSCTTTSMMP